MSDIRTLLAGLIVAVVGSITNAGQVFIDPSDVGSLYICPSCNPNPVRFYDGEMVVAGYIQGDVKFSTSSIPGTITQASLRLIPSSFPVWGPNVQVYGFASNSPTLSMSDANSGTYIGTWVYDEYGPLQDLDVTTFLQGIDAPYVGFNLRSDGTDTFYSPQLVVSSVPLPSAALLLISGLGGLMGARLSRRA